MPYSNISLTASTGLGYQAGDFVQISNDVNNYVIAKVVSYNPTTGAMVVTPTTFVGSGTYTSWSLNLTGSNGTAGTVGTAATSGSGGVSGTSGS